MVYFSVSVAFTLLCGFIFLLLQIPSQQELVASFDPTVAAGMLLSYTYALGLGSTLISLRQMKKRLGYRYEFAALGFLALAVHIHFLHVLSFGRGGEGLIVSLLLGVLSIVFYFLAKRSDPAIDHHLLHTPLRVFTIPSALTIIFVSVYFVPGWIAEYKEGMGAEVELLVEAAIENGDLAGVKQHAQLKYLDQSRREKLVLLAANEQRVDMLQVLFPFAGLEARTKLLGKAIQMNSPSLVQFCLDEHVDVNTVGMMGPEPNQAESPVDLAAYLGNLEVLRLLLQNGGKLDAHGKSTIDAAIRGFVANENFRPVVVDELLKLGSKRDVVNQQTGLPPAGFASQLGSLELVEKLFWDGMPQTLRDRSLFAAGAARLEFSVREPVLKFWLKKGARLSAKNERGETLLHEAVRLGELDLVKYLVTNGASPTAVIDAEGLTPFFRAIERHRLDLSGADVGWGGDDVLKYFLALPKLEMQGRDRRGRNAAMLILDIAAGSGEEGESTRRGRLSPAVQLLVSDALKAGISARDRDRNGRSVLHYAVAARAPADFLNFLIGKGADPRLRDEHGRTALELAGRRGD
ncbi:MAG: ankyrin repeat domain-containing protein [Bacteriovoracia bacterium]